jgi:hypothetical protein
MHVLLLCPSSKNTFRSVGVVVPPLGLLYIAAAVHNRGYPIQVIDLSVDHQSIDDSIFDVVGIHRDTTRFNETLALACRASLMRCMPCTGILRCLVLSCSCGWCGHTRRLHSPYKGLH